MNCRNLQRKSCCSSSSSSGTFTSYEDVVEDYLRQYQKQAQEESDFYRNLPTLDRAIDNAAEAKLTNGNRHPHQYRIKTMAIAEAGQKLQSLPLADLDSFKALHDLLNETIGQITGIGPLMVYDTALRLGFKLGLEPEDVYLHAGTKVGATAIGIDADKTVVSKEELPKAFHILKASEIEDCLCIYKDALKTIFSDAV